MFIKTQMGLSLILAIIFVWGCNKVSDHVELYTASLEPGGNASVTSQDSVFQIAIIPDSQYYTSLKHGGTMEMFSQQIRWIRDNRVSSKIAYVVHVGDVVDHGSDNNDIEWQRAKTELYKLEADLIPYGIAVGNHDQTPYGNPSSPGTANGYGLYFGRNRMQSFSWYGGAQGNSNNNDNHYDVFTVAGQSFLVIYIEFNSPGHALYSLSRENVVMDWADQVISTHPNHKVIVVSHSILNKPAGSNSDIVDGQGDNSVQSQFTNQGDIIYERMKHHSNVFLMLCGHISGEGFRRDEYNGNVIKSYLANYQSRRNSPYAVNDRNGGNGLMRIMRFDMANETLRVRTFAPRAGANILEEDEDSMFTTSLYN